jgi:hypothetical protein
MYYEDFIERVENGRQGYYQGFTTGSAKLDGAIQAVQKATYYLIGGNTGTGKTAFADHCFVLKPYEEFLKSRVNEKLNDTESKLKLRIFYNSFEVERTRKIGKFVAHHLYNKFRIITDINTIFSAGKNKLSDELYEKIKLSRDYIEKMEDYVHITDNTTNPTGIYMQLKKYMDSKGKVVPVKKMVNGVEITFNKYIPDDPYEIVLSITDHVGLLRPEKEATTKKERIDKYSQQCIDLRNFYGVSSVAISQFNRDIADMDRRRFAELTVQIEDFKDTGNASEDANIVMGLFNPTRYNLNTYSNLDISRFASRYRNVVILKQRDGSDMLKLHQNFLGEVGYFRDFPDIITQDTVTKAREYKDWI